MVPLTQAAYPVDGGHLTLTAQQDILGYEATTVSRGNGSGFPDQQYFAPWLLAQGSALTSNDFGTLAPLSGYLATTNLFTPSQTSWWINFGSFDQGLMSVGGNVRVVAGRDINQLSVSLPTTARVSGGLSNTITDANGNVVANIPVMHLDPSGDLTVIAGRNLLSGAFYEGSGTASITVGGSVSASWSLPEDGTLDIRYRPSWRWIPARSRLTARDSANIAGVVSGPSLQNVADSENPIDASWQSVSSYGPSSAVSLESVSGDIVDNSLSSGVALVYNNQLGNFSGLGGYPGINSSPANFQAVALHGNIQVADSLQLAPSNTGTLDLLAYGSLLLSDVAFGGGGGLRPISTGPLLVEASFDPL